MLSLDCDAASRLAMTGLLLLIYLFSLPVTAKFTLKHIFNTKNIKNEYQSPYKFEPVSKPSETLTIVFISDVNLCPAPKPGQTHGVGLVSELQSGIDQISKTILGKKEKAADLPVNTGILYDQSQVLLQETIREIIASLKTKGVDLVIFGGNQVYSNEYFSLFEDIAYDLQKYSIPYYYLVGSGELKGNKALNKLISDRFYLLKTKSTNIIVLDNVDDDVVPKFLPEEATEQYVWLKKVLAQLDHEISDLYIFSYKPLQARTVELINQYPHLHLKLIANSSLYNFSVNNSKDIKTTSLDKPIVLSNSSISKYPLAYTIIDRDTRGSIQITNKLIGLEGIRELAKKAVK